LATAVGIAAAAGQDVTLEELLDRASTYQRDFVERFSGIVAAERYLQQIFERGASSGPRNQRVLTSDFLLTTFPGATGWHAFRLVREVDGRSVSKPDESARLMELFTTDPPDMFLRAKQIAEDGARYNLQEIGTLNNPLLASAFLQGEYRSRFRFRLRGRAKDLGAAVRVVDFDERTRPTILRSTANDDLVSEGRMWIDEDTGRVVRTELRPQRTFGPSAQRAVAVIDTHFAFDEQLKMNVPLRMRDSYPGPYGTRFIGEATYGQFRRFQVETTQRIAR
jgi:hypothetical protein